MIKDTLIIICGIMRGSDFAELRAFAEIARQGSFARAAERLHMAPSSLSQTIRGLEERLGVTLLNRTTRRVSLTGAGARLLERFAPAMVEMEEAVRDAREQRRVPRGLVRLQVPRAAYERHVAPALGRLAETLPEVSIDVTVSDAMGDAVAAGFDIFVRRGDKTSPSLLAVDLGHDLRHAVVASHGYLASRDEPRTPEELKGHRCIQWRRADDHERNAWRFEINGESTIIAVSGTLTVSHCDVAIDAAVAGSGIAYVLEPFVTEHIRTGRLVTLLQEYLPSLAGWKLCYPRQRHSRAAVQAVIDVLVNP